MSFGGGGGAISSSGSGGAMSSSGSGAAMSSGGGATVLTSAQARQLVQKLRSVQQQQQQGGGTTAGAGSGPQTITIQAVLQTDPHTGAKRIVAMPIQAAAAAAAGQTVAGGTKVDSVSRPMKVIKFPAEARGTAKFPSGATSSDRDVIVTSSDRDVIVTSGVGSAVGAVGTHFMVQQTSSSSVEPVTASRSLGVHAGMEPVSASRSLGVHAGMSVPPTVRVIRIAAAQKSTGSAVSGGGVQTFAAPVGRQQLQRLQHVRTVIGDRPISSGVRADDVISARPISGGLRADDVIDASPITVGRLQFVRTAPVQLRQLEILAPPSTQAYVQQVPRSSGGVTSGGGALKTYQYGGGGGGGGSGGGISGNGTSLVAKRPRADIDRSARMTPLSTYQSVAASARMMSSELDQSAAAFARMTSLPPDQSAAAFARMTSSPPYQSAAAYARMPSLSPDQSAATFPRMTSLSPYQSAAAFARMTSSAFHQSAAAVGFDAFGDVKRRKSERPSKGLRHFSMKVCEKLQAKGLTSYNEVADELVAELTEPGPCTSPTDQQYDEKNIRRRVYDALNVLMAMNIISKEKKEIRWLGLPINSVQEANSLEQDKAKRIERIKAKTQRLQNLILQQIAFKNLVERNQEREKHDGYPPASNAVIQLPFIIVNTGKKTIIDCSISNDKTEYLFNFDDTFEMHDDMEVLKRLGLGFGRDRGQVRAEDLARARRMVPRALEHYVTPQLAAYGPSFAGMPKVTPPPPPVCGSLVDDGVGDSDVDGMSDGHESDSDIDVN